MNNFSITQKISFNDYNRLMFRLLYRKAFVILLSSFAALGLISFILHPIINPKETIPSDDLNYGIFVIVMAILFPVITYIQSKRGFKSNLRIQEKITIEFSEQGINQYGESFTASYTWGKVYRVRVINGWLLLYQNRIVANLIKIAPEDIPKIESLKSFLKSAGFKIKLNW